MEANDRDMANVLRKCANKLHNLAISAGRPPIHLRGNLSRLMSQEVESKEKEVRQIRFVPTMDLKLHETEGETYVEAIPIDTGRNAVLLKKDSDACVLCRLNLKGLDYTDIKIISQFLNPDTTLVSLKESKLCLKQYNILTKLLEKARRCNLIQRPSDYFVPGPWHDLNTYLETDRKRDQPGKFIRKQYWKI